MIFWSILRDLCFIEAALLYGVAWAAGSLYYARYRAAMKEGLAGRRKGNGRATDFEWIGAMPLHSWTGSLALGILLVPLIGSMVVRFDQSPHWWGLPFVFVGETLFLVSLWSVVRYELRLIR